MKTPILQFGTSRFLQAHADLFISEASKTGNSLGPITVVQTTGSAERGKRLGALAAEEGFPVVIRGRQSGRTIDDRVTVRSVKRALSISQAYNEVRRIFSNEAEVVICNTADRGYDISFEASVLPVEVPLSFPGKLLKLLYERWQANGGPLTILPAELISRNGGHLKHIVFDLSRQWALPHEFTQWMSQHVIFANTLVDRIVSQALEPAGAVAEPYALWAVEMQDGLKKPCLHPAIIYTDDISKYEHLKLFILNLGHTLLAEKWSRSDLSRDMFVRELISLPEYRSYLLNIYESEILPGFARMKLAGDAEDYVHQTLERFENPFLDHRLADIFDNHAEKVRRRAGGFLAWSNAEAPRLAELLDTYAT